MLKELTKYLFHIVTFNFPRKNPHEHCLEEDIRKPT